MLFCFLAGRLVSLFFVAQARIAILVARSRLLVDLLFCSGARRLLVRELCQLCKSCACLFEVEDKLPMGPKLVERILHQEIGVHWEGILRGDVVLKESQEEVKLLLRWSSIKHFNQVTEHVKQSAHQANAEEVVWQVQWIDQVRSRRVAFVTIADNLVKH